MANYQATKIEQESHTMIGGEGIRSYTQNSSYQKAVVDAAKQLINEGVIDKLDFESLCFTNNSNNTFRIADFGCSVGPNTFLAVENIIKAVETKYKAEHRQDSPAPTPLEFQVFFSDLTGNDFNTLFKALPSYQKSCYFAAGVPGSFYTRLFPRSSLHFAHSSSSLVWLSKVPAEVVDSKSAAWNKGSIQCTGLAKEVAVAYSAQFKKDIDLFLSARAEEIVGGGLMVILTTGIPDGVLFYQTLAGKIYEILGSSLDDLVKMGVLSQEKVDSFNVPQYFARPKELEEIIKGNEHFSIEIMKTQENPMFHKKLGPEHVVPPLRAVCEGLFREQFGDENIVDQIFNYFSNKLVENSFIFEESNPQTIEMYILLKRNN